MKDAAVQSTVEDRSRGLAPAQEARWTDEEAGPQGTASESESPSVEGQALEERRKRVVLHVDVDAFYCSVERLDDPSLRGRPMAVTQFNRGGFVSVSHEVPPPSRDACLERRLTSRIDVRSNKNCKRIAHGISIGGLKDESAQKCTAQRHLNWGL